MAAIKTRALALLDEVRKTYGPNYPELLARLCEDDEIDDYSDIEKPTPAGFKSTEASKRLSTILSASESAPGRHFSGIMRGWTDVGFKAEFKDPHKSSQNQCGHFLTAVHLSFAPACLYEITSLAHVHDLGRQSANLLAAQRLAIGHEFVADDAHGHAARAYFNGAWYEDTFRRAVQVMHKERRGSATGWANVSGASEILKKLPIDGTQVGNSHADMLLTAVGWYLGQLVVQGVIDKRDDHGAFIRDVLSNNKVKPSKPLPPVSKDSPTQFARMPKIPGHAIG